MDPDTGEYTSVGAIERMSRLLDTEVMTSERPDPNGGLSGIPPYYARVERLLFGHHGIDQQWLDDLRPCRKRFGLSEEHILSAREWERDSRHKMNPNIPTLGTRQDLLDADILTNELPGVR